VLAWKLVDSTFRGPSKNAKFFRTGRKEKKKKKKKKTRTNFVRKSH